MEKYLGIGLAFIGGMLLGAMIEGIYYERRWRRALELERERERMRRYHMVED